MKENEKLDELYRNSANAYKFLSNLKKFQMYEQIFENNVQCKDTYYQPDAFNQMKNMYTIMKFAVFKTGGINVFRHVDIPWWSYSRNKVLRNYIKQCLNVNQPKVVELQSEIDPKYPLVNQPKLVELHSQTDLKAFSCDLVKLDFDCLKDGIWILDSIVTEYCDYIVQAHKKTDVYVFHSTVIDQTDGNVVLDKEKFNYFVLPMHVNRNHWAMVIISKRVQKMFYLDSLSANSLFKFDQNPINLKKTIL